MEPKYVLILDFCIGCLPHLFKQLEFIEPDEACDISIEVLPGKF